MTVPLPLGGRLATHKSGFQLEEISSKLGLDLTRQRRISLLPRHFSFLICFLRPEKTKNTPATTNENSHHMGRNSAVPPNFSRKIGPSFPSITRTSRRILISALSLKLWNRGSKKKQSRSFRNTMGYLQSLSPQTRTTRLLSQSRKSSYSSQRGKNLNTKTILPQTTEFVNTTRENILV